MFISRSVASTQLKPPVMDMKSVRVETCRLPNLILRPSMALGSTNSELEVPFTMSVKRIANLGPKRESRALFHPIFLGPRI